MSKDFGGWSAVDSQYVVYFQSFWVHGFERSVELAGQWIQERQF